MNEFENWKIKKRTHKFETHEKQWREYTIDTSCTICYTPRRKTTEKFRQFWEWYQDIVPAVEYSGATEQYFDRLIREENEKKSVVLVNRLIESVRYNLKPRLTLLQIKSEILTILVASKRFTLPWEETLFNYQVLVDSQSDKSNKNSSPELQVSPQHKSPKQKSRENSPPVEKEEDIIKDDPLVQQVNKILREAANILDEDTNSKEESITTGSNSESEKEINLEDSEPEVEQEINLEENSDSGNETTTNESDTGSEEENMGITNQEMRNIFQTFMGVDGAHLTNLAIGLNNATAMNQEVRNEVRNLVTGQANRSGKIVEAPTFSGKEDEDPHEWITMYNQAFTTNGWREGNNQERKIAIAAGHFKGAAQDWYQEDSNNIQRWHDNTHNGGANNFTTRLLNRFSSQTQRNRWTMELQTIKQRDGEKVEDYAIRFKKLMNKATHGNVLPDIYQVNYFINGLVPTLVGQTVMNNPQNLNEAVERAKAVEVGVQYTLQTMVMPTNNQTLNNNVPVQRREEDAIEELTKRFEKMEIKLMNRINKVGTEITCFACEKKGHRANECKAIKCYKCGKEDHTIKFCKATCGMCGQDNHITEKCYKNRECSRCGQKGHSEKFCKKEVRRVNYTTYDYESEEEAEYYYSDTEEESDSEVYVTTRSGKKYHPRSESKREVKFKRNRRSDDDMDIDDEKIKVKRNRKKSRIEKLKPYNIVEDLENVKSNVTIAQMLQDPKQRKYLKEALRGEMRQELDFS